MQETKEYIATKKLVPQLRFKEFEEEWEKLKLEEVSDKIQDGTHFSPQLLETGNYKYITSRNIRNGYMEISDVPYLSDEAHRDIYKRCNVQLNDILLTKDGSATGTVCMNTLDEEFSLLSSVAFIRGNKSLALNDFIYQCIAGPMGQREILASIAGQAITRITLTKLRNFKFSYPTLPEQQKIASFLSAVDEKIQQLTKKKALLEQYKKGVMQQLFSQKLRFKDEHGNPYPDWEEKRLGEIGKTFNGLTGKTKEDFGEGKPYIQYMQIFRGSKINPDEFGFVKLNENEKQSRAQFGDAFFTTSSETPKEIGTASVLLDKIEELYLNSFCFGYRPNNIELLVPQFLQFLLRSEIFRRKIIPLAQGSTRYNMSKVELMKLKVDIPQKEEQQKIATYLSSIDTKIEVINNQIIKTQTFKKGLLQQMFV
ncbi:restriction endonuclease subunit S [Yeosuana sp. MJ-SS3]|uniref:Restriction endonuclease subunit S n=1 Tax=Gilvirhabdus luticola TaxID=3079858 RepID=A0ABU3U7L8_9FLAO|nr:restriction endonuclease subunit S [Yeosuana sp. MJ-SS3]MDU8886317.1 restriction endonuclease subunit S [Yeosuana sp. MJ-SS3]